MISEYQLLDVSSSEGHKLVRVDGNGDIVKDSSLCSVSDKDLKLAYDCNGLFDLHYEFYGKQSSNRLDMNWLVSYLSA